jgi:hypothetical protein
MQTSPTVLDIIALLGETRGALLAQLRADTLALRGVEERTLYDGFCREWTPAYYLGKGQLFHVHNFHSRLRATMFVSVRTLEPVILDAGQIPHELRLLVAQTPGHRTKQVKVPIDSAQDVAGFKELVKVKWDSLCNQPPGASRRS